MGLFDILKTNKTTNKNIFDIMPELKFTDYHNLVSACVGKAIAYQTRFEEIILRNEEWAIDILEGNIDISSAIYPIQLLGIELTEADKPTWLWAWGSQQDLPMELLRDSLLLKDLGEINMFKELSEPSHYIDNSISGDLNSSVAINFNEQNVCYCRCPYQSGAIYVLVKNLPSTIFLPLDGNDVLSAIRNAIGRYKINHKTLVRAMMLQYGKRLKVQPNKMSCITSDKKKLTIIFDESEKIYSANIFK